MLEKTRGLGEIVPEIKQFLIATTQTTYTMKQFSEVIICMKQKSLQSYISLLRNQYKKDFLLRALQSDAIVLTQNISLEVQN